MTTIQIANHIFAVDVNRTKEYYQTHTLCDCDYCRNYYKQIKGKFPQLEAFLSQFGVDISKPDEISSCTYEDEIDYYAVYYSVCGEITKDSEYEIDIYDNLFLSIVVHDDIAPPNEQTGQYFTFSVFQIRLPWVLDEPLNPTAKERVFDKFHEIFKKITRS